jgi:hypothetical protein
MTTCTCRSAAEELRALLEERQADPCPIHDRHLRAVTDDDALPLNGDPLLRDLARKLGIPTDPPPAA